MRQGRLRQGRFAFPPVSGNSGGSLRRAYPSPSARYLRAGAWSVPGVNRSRRAVWDTLSDLAGYCSWNPFIIGAAGTISDGQRLDLTIQPPGARAMRFNPWVTAVEQHRYIEWLGHLGLPGIFDGRHSLMLTPMTRGRTLLQQSETFTGVLTPFAGSMLARTRAGFDMMNDALARATSRAPTPRVDDPPGIAKCTMKERR